MLMFQRDWTKTQVAFSQPCAIIPSIVHVFLIGQILLAQYGSFIVFVLFSILCQFSSCVFMGCCFFVFRFVDIANSNLKIRYVVFAKLRRISGCVLYVGLLAAGGMNCVSCNQHGELIPSRPSKVNPFLSVKYQS